MIITEETEIPVLSSGEILYDQYQDKLLINKKLTRSLISFQANKTEPFYRWFKYKEGFSKSFVHYVLDTFGDDRRQMTILDPFAGAGTTLIAGAEAGFNTLGIELLPHAITAVHARLAVNNIDWKGFTETVSKLKQLNFEDTNVSEKYFFKHITITQGAFSQSNEVAIANFQRFIIEEVSDPNIHSLLFLVALSILEDVSYTRKDGQYLRWDSRAGKKLKSTFNKGPIHNFRQRFFEKVALIEDDTKSLANSPLTTSPRLLAGSCLHRLHEIESESVDLVITSPPYCNRYDYTRTYALELAFCGVDNEHIKNLRQTLLSATVENRSKRLELARIYDNLDKSDAFSTISRVYDEQSALHELLQQLNKDQDRLNNKNIIGMIANYFFEMNFVISELARTLRPGGKVIMVNDNVQYNGYEVPVDLILSDFAASAGLRTKAIWLLEKGKGNSSQQMGLHGRNEIRKCVYVWEKQM